MSTEQPDYSPEGTRKRALISLKAILGRKDELPKERLTTKDPKSEYKCTGNSFSVVAMWLEQLIDINIITDPDVLEKCQNFINYSKAKEKSKELTKLEEIEYINEIIKLAIQYLESPEDKKDSD